MPLGILIFSLWLGQMHVQHQQKLVYQMQCQGLLYTWRLELMRASWRHRGMTMSLRRLYSVCNMIERGVTPLHIPEDLKAMGFHLIVHSLTSLYASARALVDILKTLKANGTTRDHLQKMAIFEEFNQSINLGSWFELEARFKKGAAVKTLEGKGNSVSSPLVP